MTPTQRATLRMFALAHPDNRADPVALADQRTSLADARSALCMAVGVPVEQVGPLGHDMTSGRARGRAGTAGSAKRPAPVRTPAAHVAPGVAVRRASSTT